MRHRTVGMGLGLALMAGSALGQEAPAPQQPPLQGPRVQENRAPHVQDDFSDGMKGREGRAGPQISMRAYSEIIGRLRGEKAPEDLRLSEDQEQKLIAIEKEYREATRAYVQQQREQRGEQKGEEQNRRPAGQAPADAPQRPRREAAMDMMRNGPKAGDYQTRIWAILNEKQQGHVKVELDKAREELQKRRGEEMMQRRIEQQRDVKPGAPGRPGAEPERPMRERVQKLMRRMAQLPEGERDQLIKRLEDEMDRRGIPEVPEGERPPQP